MKWPWRKRSEAAEDQAKVAEADLLLARVDYLKAHDLAGEARRAADKSRKAHAENGFADLIRAAIDPLWGSTK